MLRLFYLLLWSDFIGTTLAAADSHIKVSNVWAFPLGTWIKNLAIRSNGQILATDLAKPQIYQVDPTLEKPSSLVATIPSHFACLGITETKEDEFYVVAGNYSLGSSDFAKGSYAVWKVDVSDYRPGHPITPSLVANFPQSGILNGMATVNERIVVIPDSLGAIWRLNVQTKKKRKILEGSLLAPVKALGVNGIKVKDSNLFFDNSDQGILVKVPISSTGLPTGSPKVIVTHLTGPDDFDVGSTDNIKGSHGFVAGNDALQRFAFGRHHLLSNSSLLEGSTACRISRSGVVYVSTNGGAEQYSGTLKNPGKVVQVTIDRHSMESS